MKEQLKAIRNGDINSESYLDQLVELAYTIMYATFNFGNRNSRKQPKKLKALLKKELKQDERTYENYLSFCQRILLLEEICFICNHSPVSPEALLDPGFSEYSISKAMMDELRETRKKHPLEGLKYRAMAECLLDICEIPTRDNICYWQTWFLDHDFEKEFKLVIYSVFLFLAKPF
jgi:hypothetical protein